MHKILHEIALKWHRELSPVDLEGYLSRGGFKAYHKALDTRPEEIIEVIESSGLRGRGGAGFPTGIKWKFAYQESGDEKYLIANADEGEPGTFKDRYIMELVPYRFLEGMMIAAIAIGSGDARIYIRHEYTRAIGVLREAIRRLYQAGYVGKNIMNTGLNLDLSLTTGAGSYLCGDETTLLESMEGRRGNPRFKPPFPAQQGFRGKPTVVNNVETLAHVPDIILGGAEWYRTIGTQKSPGTKLYCLSGRVQKPGVYEMPMGTTLRTLLYDCGQGLEGGVALKGALLGGAAGTFVGTDMLDVPMDYDHLKEHGATLGSGAVIIFGSEDSVSDMLTNILHFFKNESCGKCVPCRVGCYRLMELNKVLRGRRNAREMIMEDMLRESAMMASASLCGLGQSPILPVRSVFRHFKNDFLNLPEEEV